MMLPSTLLYVFVFISEHKKRRAKRLPYVPASVFLAGYILGWTVFSALAAWLQVELIRASLLMAALTPGKPLFAGIRLAATGANQWTPYKGFAIAALS